MILTEFLGIFVEVWILFYIGVSDLGLPIFLQVNPVYGSRPLIVRLLLSYGDHGRRRHLC